MDILWDDAKRLFKGFLTLSAGFTIIDSYRLSKETDADGKVVKLSHAGSSEDISNLPVMTRLQIKDSQSWWAKVPFLLVSWKASCSHLVHLLQQSAADSFVYPPATLSRSFEYMCDDMLCLL